MTRDLAPTVNKIATVTLSFWIMKVVATTLGETAGDFVAQTMDLGYVAGLGITLGALAVLLGFQMAADRHRPALFWAAIVATTTAGTEISDLMDRTLGLGYPAGALLLSLGLLATLYAWHRKVGTLKVDPVAGGAVEGFFWLAVIFSNSLGTAFGDFLVDSLQLGYLQGAMICSAVIGVVLALHYGKAMNEVALFWIAFVFTRPFGATFGDFLTKPLSSGGLDLGTLWASTVSVALLATVLALSCRRERARAAVTSQDSSSLSQ